MARHDEVDHGHLHGKIVRVYPERTNLVQYRKELKHYTDKECLETDEQIVASILAHAAERGYQSGTVCKVVMVSRLGDCGLSKRLRDQHGYSLRVNPECLEVVSEEERPRLLHEFDMGRS